LLATTEDQMHVKLHIGNRELQFKCLLRNLARA